MQKNAFYLFLLICSMSLFTSCKDDDNKPDNEKTDWASKIAGTYKGNLAVIVDGADLGSFIQFITISRENTNITKLELKDFTITIAGTPIKIGNITVGSIPVSDVNSTVSLQETSTVINHASLGQLNVKVTGVVDGNKANLHIIVYGGKQQQNIDATFSGEKTEDITDATDHAVDIAAWYKRESLTITGDTINSIYPNDGVSAIYQAVNTIAIESFKLSFPSNAAGASPSRTIPQIDSIVLIKGGNSILIDTIRMTIPPQSKQDTAYMVLSGNFQGKTLTLNIELATKNKKANYIFTGTKKQTGATLDKMILAGDVVTVQPEIATTHEDGKFNIMFYVKEGTANAQLNLVPTFTLAGGASILHKGEAYIPGTPVDFSQDQEFTVKAESGKKNTYLVKHEVLNTDLDFSSNFEAWEMKNFTTDSTNMFQIYEEPINGWGTSNGGVSWIKIFEELYSQSAPYAVVQTNEGKSGKAARLETLYSSGQAANFPYFSAIPNVISGTVFSGTFTVNTNNILKSTKFGYPCFKKPMSFQGSYKYTPGNDYYYCADPVKANEAVIDRTKTDAPAINAVLYEVDRYAFDFLDGTNLLTSDKIVAKASVKNPSATSSYVDFNINFDWGTKTFDPAKKYKLAIVCSSSKDGDKFSGAPGSALYVDDLKVNF